MRKWLLFLCVLPLLLAVSPWPDTGGTGGTSTDINGDNRFELSGVWDADGDGSGYVTCSAKDVPFPQCRFDGHVIYPDFSDDFTCMLPGLDGLAGRCGANPGDRTMAYGGTVQLLAGVDYIVFPCWEIDDWMADPSTPGSAPSDAGINDPRDSTRWDTTGDAADKGCPTDEHGGLLAVAQTGFWSGKLVGGGQDNRLNSDFTAAATQIGTRIVGDTGRTTYFGQMSFGFFAGLLPTNCTGGVCSTLALSEGIGALASQYGTGIGAGHIARTINTECIGLTSAVCASVCVCNDAVCNGTHRGKATGWVQGDLAAGDLGYTYLSTTDVVNNPVSTRVRIDSIAAADGTGVCSGGGHLDYREVVLGWESFLDTADTFAHGTPWWNIKGSVNCDSAALCSFIVPPPEFFATNLEFSDFSFVMQDDFSDGAGDCDDAPVGATDVSGNALVPTDAECDTAGVLKIHGGGHLWMHDLGIANSAHGIDGFNLPVDVKLDRINFENMNAVAISDAFQDIQWRDIRITNSVFRGRAPMGGFTTRHIVDGMLIENVHFGGLISLEDAEANSVFRNIELRNTSYRALFTLRCGTYSNVFENIWVHAYNSYSSSSSSHVFNIQCQAADPDNPITANLFRNVTMEPPGWTPYGNNGQIGLVMFDDDNGSTASCGVDGCLIYGNTFENFTMRSSDADSCMFYSHFSRPNGQDTHNDLVARNNTFRGLNMTAGYPFCYWTGSTTAEMPTYGAPNIEGSMIGSLPYQDTPRIPRGTGQSSPLFQQAIVTTMDTCDLVCDSHNRSCIDGDLMGSSGAATTCATVQTAGLNMWCACGPYE